MGMRLLPLFIHHIYPSIYRPPGGCGDAERRTSPLSSSRECDFSFPALMIDSSSRGDEEVRDGLAWSLQQAREGSAGPANEPRVYVRDAQQGSDMQLQSNILVGVSEEEEREGKRRRYRKGRLVGCEQWPALHYNDRRSCLQRGQNLRRRGARTDGNLVSVWSARACERMGLAWCEGRRRRT